MCGGGGDAVAAQEKADRAKQAAVSSNVAAIDSAYAGREPQYADYTAALQKQYGTELQRQQGVAQRQSKFALAKSGNTGGSVAVDQGNELNREATQAAITSEKQAQGQTAKLRSADEQTRLGLISTAQSGGDIGNAATQAANSLKANLGAAQSEGATAALGDLFSNTTKSYNKAQQDAALRKGYGSVYGKAWGS